MPRSVKYTAQANAASMSSRCSASCRDFEPTAVVDDTLLWVLGMFCVLAAIALIAVILVLANLANYSGGSTAMGQALAAVGPIFPLIAPIIGWIGDVLGPRWTIGIGAAAVGITLVVVSIWLGRHENVEVTYSSQDRKSVV